jgi:hybrid cluster-associated redox disulfide protein
MLNARLKMSDNFFTPDMIVAEVLKTWPQTIQVFLHHKTACVGCALSPFETLVDVSRNYQIPMSKLLLALAESIQD